MTAAGLGTWDPLDVDEVRALMSGFAARWWISGGQALELHLGRSWRDHEDIDVGVCRRDVPRLHNSLRGWEMFVAVSGELVPWSGRTVHPERGENNLWVRRPGGPWRLDVTVGEGDEHDWISRRDPSFRLRWDRAVLSARGGVPYLAPAVQLLFKSKDIRPKDQIDAETVIPQLDAESLALLDARLPTPHPWRPLLGDRG